MYLAYYFNAIAEFHLSQSETELAIDAISRAKNISSDYGLPLIKIDSLIIEARLLSSNLQPSDTTTDIEQSLRIAEQSIVDYGYSYRALDINLLRGELALSKGSLTADMVSILKNKIDKTRRKSLLNRWNKLSQAITAGK